MTTKEQAQNGFLLLKEAILEYIRENPNKGNTEIARALGIETQYENNQRNYLSYSILGMLLNEGKIKYVKNGNRKQYFIK